ncbi:MAG: hypothetical protein KDD82_28895 [Planctomycetes bacterium]|nr:hypothetical protein [Planctomycetota bacterium]
MNRSSALSSLLLVGIVASSARADGVDSVENPILAQVRSIQQGVAKMRGLEYQAPVKVGVKKPEELLALLQESFDEEAPVEEVLKQEKVLKAFGLIPRDYDLRGETLKLMSSQIGGFYDPERKELFLVERKLDGVMGKQGQEMNDRMVMAHELHHALQDQNFALDRWFAVLGEHEDRVQGYKSLVEGEAQLMGMAFLMGKNVDLKGLNRMQKMMMKMSPEGKEMAAIPPYILENTMFPYTQGGEFVQELKRKLGWDGVSAAFSDPPTSTEQVLHPEKFFGERDEPTELRLPSTLKTQLGKKTTELYGNTLGEFSISLLLRALGLDEKAANAAAAGWDGDRFEGYETEDGRTVVVWLSTWDSAAEAEAFQRAYAPALKAHSPSAHLERRGTEVLLLDGANEDERAALAERAFLSLKVEERIVPLPAMTGKPPRSDFGPEPEPEPQQKGKSRLY